MFRAHKTNPEERAAAKVAGAEQMAAKRQARAEHAEAKRQARAEKRQLKLEAKRAKVANRQAAHDALVEKTGRAVSHAPVSHERFKIDVTDNLTGAGGPLGKHGNSISRYRVVVTDSETGRPQYVAQSPSYRMGYADAERYVAKLVKGTKIIK